MEVVAATGSEIAQHTPHCEEEGMPLASPSPRFAVLVADTAASATTGIVGACFPFEVLPFVVAAKVQRDGEIALCCVGCVCAGALAWGLGRYL